MSRSLSWIPTKILHCYYRPSAEDMLCVERCLLSCLVPVNLKPEERMERMINVYSTLEDENANKYLHCYNISLIILDIECKFSILAGHLMAFCVLDMRK